MPRGKKIRRIDYNRKEMMELCGINSRPTFNSCMDKLCETYGFEIEDFKIDNSKNGDYYFPADIAEPLSMLIRNLNKYPFYRANAVTENITGTQIEEYNRILCQDIEDRVNDVFRKLIYTLPSHLQALEISDLTSVLIERLTLFILNITKLDHQEIGETIKWLCNTLDEANYNLFRGSYVKNKAFESNQAYFEEHYKKQHVAIHGVSDDKLVNIESEMMKPDNSIDYSIAMLVKRIMCDIKDLNSSDKGKEFLTPEDNNLLFLMGLRIVDGHDDNEDEEPSSEDKERQSCSNFIERDLYYRSIIKQYLDEGKYMMAESVVDNHNQKIKNKKSIVEKIKNGQFKEPCEVDFSRKKEILEHNLKMTEEQLRALEKEKDALPKEAEEFLTDMKKAYVKYCETTMNEVSEIKDAVDRFVGQVLINSMNTKRKL